MEEVLKKNLKFEFLKIHIFAKKTSYKIVTLSSVVIARTLVVVRSAPAWF